MAKSKFGIQFEGFSELMEELDKLGGELEEVAEECLIAAHEEVTPLIKADIAKEVIPVKEDAIVEETVDINDISVSEDTLEIREEIVSTEIDLAEEVRVDSDTDKEVE